MQAGLCDGGKGPGWVRSKANKLDPSFATPKTEEARSNRAALRKSRVDPISEQSGASRKNPKQAPANGDEDGSGQAQDCSDDISP